MTDYRVALDVYNGPMDLLLFLIKREEIDIYDIPISRITGQYLQYVQLLEKLDPETISEFLVVAATLMEIKSRTLLPRPPALEDDEELDDPRLELVRQLLEYKRFKDAAHSLGEAAGRRAMQHTRVPVQPPPPEEEIELENVEIWDLFEAFNRLLEQTGKAGGVHTVGVDDTPITLHAEDIVDSIQRAGGEQEFVDIFAGRTLAEMIGLFLALLELMRQHRVRVSQERPQAPILIVLLDSNPLDVESLDPTDDDETNLSSSESFGESRDGGGPDNDASALDDEKHETGNDGGEVCQGGATLATDAQLPFESVVPTVAGELGHSIQKMSHLTGADAERRPAVDAERMDRTGQPDTKDAENPDPSHEEIQFQSE